MDRKVLTTRILGVVLGILLSAGVMIACGADSEGTEGQDSAGGEMSTGEGTAGGGGEHGAGGEAGGETGGEAGGEGASASSLALDETFDHVRSGARLILRYDAPSNSFTGTVENTTSNVLTRVRIEIHLTNGTELGPTAPVDMAPGEVLSINLAATPEPFTGWTPHAEVGSGEGGGEGTESGGESGSEGRGTEGGDEGPGGEGGGSGVGAEASEAAMSSPVVPLDQQWNGVLGGLAVWARYDTVTDTVYTTAENTLSQVLCYVQTEPHLKSGATTVAELGPGVMGHLSPGQVVTSKLTVADEPSAAGISFDGYITHMEVFDCGGTGPAPHPAGQGGQGAGGEGGGGEGAGGEGHGPGGEGGSEGGSEGAGQGSGSGGEEGSGSMLALDETFDQVRAGARLILRYDPPSNSFRGTVENTTSGVLTRVRIEVHLSNGTELGPTVPVDMAPGMVLSVNMAATPQPFTGWTPHAEVGSGEGDGGGEGSEGGGEGSESGEHGGEGGEGGEG